MIRRFFHQFEVIEARVANELCHTGFKPKEDISQRFISRVWTIECSNAMGAGGHLVPPEDTRRLNDHTAGRSERHFSHSSGCKVAERHANRATDVCCEFDHDLK